MNIDNKSYVLRNKKNWFIEERKTKFRVVEPTHRYFMSQIKKETNLYWTEHKEELLQHHPDIYYSMQGKKLPKKYQKTVATDVVATTNSVPDATRQNELDAYQKQREEQRKQEQLDKRSQISLVKPLSFSAGPKKDPCRGMRFVNPYESINQGRLGHSQTWKYKKEKKYEYYG
jgi:hypothetical protein